MAEAMPRDLLSPEQARVEYGLRPATDNMFASTVDRALAECGIAQIDMSLTPGDFKQLTDSFDACIEELGELLPDTYHVIDHRLDNSAGYVRKEQKVNHSGRQIEDPKSLIHFTETAQGRWSEQFKHGPKMLRDFLDAGFEIQNILVTIAAAQAHDLEETHPNFSKLYFPDQAPHRLSFMRILSYDGYTPDAGQGDVAKPHYDRGGLTIQAYADAEGFWAAHNGPRGERVHYDTADNQAFFFLGKEHEMVYGTDSYLRPLWHGVDRIVPEGATHIPNRHAVILFVDAPHVDHGITAKHTVPYVVEQPSQPADEKLSQTA